MADIATLTVRINAATGELTAELKALQGTAKSALGGLSTMAVAAGTALGTMAAGAASAVGQMALDVMADVIDLAGTLNDLSASTGLSTDTLQEFKFAAEQSGTSLETIAAASVKLGQNLTAGTDGAVEAMSDLGLSVDAVLAMDPEARFRAISAALAPIEDDTKRNALGVALMGKAFTELDPAIQELDELTEQARQLGVVIDSSTVASAAKFGDQMDILKTQGMALIAEFLAPLLPVVVNLATAMMQWAQAVLPAVSKAILDLQKWVASIDLTFAQWMRSLIEAGSKIPGLGKILGDTSTAAKYFDDEIARGTKQLRLLNEQGAKTGQVVPPALEETGRVAGLTSKEWAKLSAEGDKATAAAKKLADELDALTGRDTLKGAADLEKQLTEIGGASQVAGHKAKAVSDEFQRAVDVAKQMGRTVPQAWREITLQTAAATTEVKAYVQALQFAITQTPTVPTGLPGFSTEPLTLGAKALGQAGLEAAEGLQAFRDQWGDTAADIMQTPLIESAPVTAAARKAFNEAGDASAAAAKAFGMKLSNNIIAAITGGGDIAKAIGATIGQALGGKIGASIGQSLGDKLGKLVGGKIGTALGAGVGEAFGEVAGALGGAALGALFGKLFGPKEHQKVNDMRDGFISAAGGLQALNERAHDAGMTLDALLKAKTVIQFESAVAQLEGAFGKVALASQTFRLALDRANESGAILGRDTVAHLADIKAGTEDAAAAFTFFQQQTQRAAGGVTTFLQNATVSSQASATALTSSLGAIFEDMRLQGMSSGEALAALSPAILAMQEQLTKTGLDGGAAFNHLAVQAGLAKDEVAGPLYAAIGGLGDLMGGLANSGRINQEIFGGLSLQITDTWGELVKMGKGGAAGMALIQPELQDIWELQKDFGFEVDESTSALLDMAEESGMVGDQFRSDQDKMTKAIETLVARMTDLVKVLSDTLPKAADTGATGVQRELDGIKPPTIIVPYKFVAQNDLPDGGSSGGSGGEARGAAAGPTLRTPTGLIGAAGVHVNVNVDGERIAEASSRYMGRVLAPYGV